VTGDIDLRLCLFDAIDLLLIHVDMLHALYATAILVSNSRHYASVVYAVFVCLSMFVRPSVTSRHRTKIAKHRIM